MTKGDKVKYVGDGAWYGKECVFDCYTNKAKTRCRFFIDGCGCVGFAEDLENLE